jgi:MFS family permease
MAVGYPVGAVLGGSIAVRLLAGHPWNAVFWLGAGMTFAAVPLVLAFIPESVAWLSGRQNPRYLGRLNHSLLRLGYPTLQAMPAAVIPHDLGSVGAVFRKPLLGRTGLLSLAYLFHSLTFYFFLKWLPKLLVDMGFAPSTAGGVLVWANVGGIVGGLLLGFLALKHGARAVTIVLLVASTVAIALFGRTAHDLTQLTAICMLCDFCANGALVGIFAVIARSYPSELRASGTGIASGVGRGGAFAAPIIAGALLQSGMGLPSVALLIGLSSLLAAGCLLALPPYAIEGGSRS